jgi:anaerobic selenocysteine-containing dehydrogenase
MVQSQVGDGLTRRDFLEASALFAAQVAAGSFLTGCASALSAGAPPTATTQPSLPTTAPASVPSPVASRALPMSGWREAKYYEPLVNSLVRCAQCPRRCTIVPGGRGFCQTRENQGGKLYSVVKGHCEFCGEPIVGKWQA